MRERLENIAEKMVKRGTGILAADESSGTIAKRFQTIQCESNEGSRRDWRQLLFSTQEAMTSYISGVILFDETIRQKTRKGEKLTSLISDSNALIGIKVDKGAQKMAGAQKGETITEGLDGLRERLAEYRDLGADFAKWRAVISIGAQKPSRLSMEANAHALARYGALCQEIGIVPIIEPEIVMDGEHSIDDCFQATETLLTITFRQLRMAHIHLEGMVLKPNMVIAGKTCPQQNSIEEVAQKTLTCLKHCVPACVPGIAFLSGGQSETQASAHLNAMNQMGDAPWALTFSYGRALQASALLAWRGLEKNQTIAQQCFHHRAKMNGLASQGLWSQKEESQEPAPLMASPSH